MRSTCGSVPASKHAALTGERFVEPAREIFNGRSDALLKDGLLRHCPQRPDQGHFAQAPRCHDLRAPCQTSRPLERERARALRSLLPCHRAIAARWVLRPSPSLRSMPKTRSSAAAAAAAAASPAAAAASIARRQGKKKKKKKKRKNQGKFLSPRYANWVLFLARKAMGCPRVPLRVATHSNH